MTIDQFQQFISTHPGISILSLSRESKVSYRTLSYLIKGKRNGKPISMSKKVSDKLEPVLTKYGFKNFDE